MKIARIRQQKICRPLKYILGWEQVYISCIAQASRISHGARENLIDGFTACKKQKNILFDASKLLLLLLLIEEMSLRLALS